MNRQVAVGMGASLRKPLLACHKAGVKQVIFLQQTDHTPHEHVIDKLTVCSPIR